MPQRRVWASGVVFATSTVLVLATVLVTAAVGAAPHAASPGSYTGPRPEVQQAVHHDVSPPLRTLAHYNNSSGQRRDMPLRLLPVPHGASVQADPVVQSAAPGPKVGTTAGFNFNGVGDTSNTPANPCNCAPSDTNGAAGATQFVQWVNTAFAVYNKSTGALIMGPTAGNALWAGFGGGCEANNDGDIIAQYDKANNRWVLSQFSVSTTPFLQCVAVSTTSDATGTYNRYAFTEPNFNDYPKIGIWPDGYYASFNIFNGNTFTGARACAFDSAAMRAGGAATQVCFQLSSSFGSLLPSDVDGTTAPPAGSPDFFLNFGTNSLNLWKFHVDFTTPGNSTFAGPTNIPVAAFTAACSGGGTCIPQPGTRNQLDSLADRLMYRLAYRNRGGTESLVVNHSVTVSGSKRSSITGIRWYELRVSRTPDPTGTVSVFQQGTFAPDSSSRWMGSIAMDKVGDIAMGYSVSSSTVFPGIRYTGRVPADALGTMEAENTILTGTASQTGTLHRWGDYSSMSVDPVDDCTFWYTTEYIPSSGSFNWATRIASFKFPGCV
ncbi:MAG TPA: hypothetical protein VIC85_13045 [Ktedonobacterales bacterium]